MPLIMSAQVTTVQRAALTGTQTSTNYLLAWLNQADLDALDVDAEDVEVSYSVVKLSDGTEVLSGTLTQSEAFDNVDNLFTAPLAFDAAATPNDGSADGYMVKVYISDDIDLGDNADPDFSSQFGSSVDHDDIAAVFVPFSFT